MYGLGGGRWSQFCAQSCTREDTQGTGNGPGITHYSESDQSCNLRGFTGTHPVFRGMAHRPSVVRSTFRCLVSWTLRHGMASLYPDFTQTKPGWAPGFQG